MGTPGIAARVFSALAGGGINVVAIAQGSSELNISFVVAETQAAEAQRRIHDAFQLSKIGGGGVAVSERADVVLLGFGQVGRTLADLIAKASRRAGLRLVAVIDRHGYVFRPEGLSSRDVAGLSQLKGRTRSVADSPRGVRAPAAQAVSKVAEHALSRPILVDVTADDTASLLERAVALGFDLVLANKRPLSGPRAEGLRIESAARGNGKEVRFEATVGAGLPILDTYRKLVESGDQVSKIEGCLSGNKPEGEVAPSSSAQRRQGLREVQETLELRALLRRAEARVVEVLAPAGRVGSHRLDMPQRVGADPDLVPRGRDDQLADALEHLDILDSLASLVAIFEAAAAPPADDSGPGAVNSPQPWHSPRCSLKRAGRIASHH